MLVPSPLVVLGLAALSSATILTMSDHALTSEPAMPKLPVVTLVPLSKLEAEVVMKRRLKLTPLPPPIPEDWMDHL